MASLNTSCHAGAVLYDGDRSSGVNSGDGDDEEDCDDGDDGGGRVTAAPAV